MINQMQEDKKCPVCSYSIPESFDENETPENQRYKYRHTTICLSFTSTINRRIFTILSKFLQGLTTVY